MVLAALFATFVPGINPALAQDDSEQPWAPAGEPGPPPVDTGSPDKAYKQTVQCVASGVGEHSTVSGSEIKDIPWGQAHLQLDRVHDYVRSHSKYGEIGVDERTGKPLKVAVIDTGVTPHEYLGNRLIAGGDYVQSGGNGLRDCDGHGTQVAGIIGADPADPAIGFTGVAPDVEIVSIRQSSQNFSEQTGSTASGERTLGSPSGAGDQSTLAQAIVRAVDEYDVDVINMSVDACRPYTGSNALVSEEERMLRGAVHYATEQNVVVVAAAGNTGGACRQNGVPIKGDPRIPDPDEPRTIVTPPWFSEDLLAVGAIDETGSVADFSMHGPWVSVAAPGTGIISLDPAPDSSRSLVNVMFEGEEAVPIQGTSFAAPYVSGLAVLVRQMYPELSAREIMHRITTTAQHPGAIDGQDQYIGYGVIDPMAALTMTLPEEIGMKPEQDITLPSSMPPPYDPNPAPKIVAFAGTGGGLLALGCTMVAVHAMRRNRKDA